MAKKLGSSRRGSRLRTLHCDPLEQRVLLSVSTFSESFAANEKLGFDLAALNYQYRQFVETNIDPTATFQARDPFLRIANEHVAITAIAADGAATELAAQLATLGLTHSASKGAVVEGLLPISSLEAMARLSSLGHVRPSLVVTNVGVTTSQADQAMRALHARSEFSVDGTGVTVGVISDSFNALGGALGDVATGDLPPLEDLNIVRDFTGSSFGNFSLVSDEGRAMMQLVYDVAPGAQLAFRTGFFGELDMARGIEELANEAGAHIIVDDLLYLSEPMFQDGHIAQAVNQVVSQNVSYFSSAGNVSNQSYEAPYRGERTYREGAFESADGVPGFEGGTMHADFFFIPNMAVGAVLNLVMQWDQPFFSVSPSSGGTLSDYDLYLFDQDFDPVDVDGTIVAASVNNNVRTNGIGSGDPLERLFFENEELADYYLVAFKRTPTFESTVSSLDVPKDIPDNGTTITSVIDFQGTGLPAGLSIIDVNVNVVLGHASPGDLVVTLVSPNGTRIRLMEGVVGNPSFFSNDLSRITYDDQADTPIADAGNAPWFGSFSPEELLSLLNGESPIGAWTIEIFDGAPGFAGRLAAWSLEIVTTFDGAPDAEPLKIVSFADPVPGISGSSTIYGHANAAGASAVGAVLYTNAPLFYGNPLVPEAFTSHGGTDILFDTLGNRLANAEDRMKPNISAPDGTNTTFFPFLGFVANPDVEPDGFPNFFGTSAAAPHAAAVAALMKQLLPTATPADIYAAMEDSAYDMLLPGYDVISGNGYLLADEALRTLVLNVRGSVEGTVYNDEDGDRVQAPGEPGLPDWTVFLDYNQNEILDEISRKIDAIQTDIPIVDATSTLNLPQTTTTSMLVYGIPTANWNNLVVTIDITHSAVGNLEIALINPAGTRVVLVDQRGNLSDNFRNTQFSDQATTPIASGLAPYTDIFIPEEALSAFLGDDPNGRWMLEITDHTRFNTGVLNDWSLTFDFDEPSVVTDADGKYLFSNLLFGNYTLATVLEPNFEQTTPFGPTRRPLLITEIDMGGVDKFEIQNVDLNGGPVDTSGWFVVISDAPFPDINQVNTTVWFLPDEIQPGEVLYRTDSPADNFFGTNIFWNKDNSRIGSGWVMIVDDLGNVIDWVGWGWTEEEIESFNVTVGGFTIDDLSSLWTGAGIDRTGPGTLQRTGSLDTNTSNDFIWYVSQSVGAQNVLAGIQLPIISPTDSSTTTVRFVNLNITGVDFGNRAIAAPVVNNEQQGGGSQSGSETPVPPSEEQNQNEQEPNDDKPAPGVNPFVATNVGLFDGLGSVFFLRDENSPGPANNVVAFGPAGAGWIPLAGDWDGNGSVTVGLYNPQTSTFYLRNANLGGVADVVFQFGPAGSGWQPLVGDWDGDGTDTVGLYSGEMFFLTNIHAGGAAQVMFGFGPAGAGWTPLVGDWDGDGQDTVGFHNGETFFLRNTHEGGTADTMFAFGPAGAGWKPVIGDWGATGRDTVALYGDGAFFLRYSHEGGAADQMFNYGPTNAGWTPVAGSWLGLGGSALMLAGEAGDGVGTSMLTQSQLDAAMSVSVSQWQAAGLSGSQLQSLRSVEFRVTDLPGGHLALALPSVIYIDSNAAGRGWQTTSGGAGTGVDLVSVISHELGHQLGLDDMFSTGDQGRLMYHELAPGERSLPTSADVDDLFAEGAWEDDELLLARVS